MQARFYKGNEAVAFAEPQNWTDRPVIIAALKSATSDVGTSDLPSAYRPVSEAFIAAMRATSIPLRLEGLRRTPLRTRVFANTQPIVAVQVAEHSNIPVLKSAWDVTELEPRKVAAITVITEELQQSTSNAAQLAITDDLAAAAAAAENVAFISPAETGSVLAAADNFASSGSTISDVDTDLRRLVALVPGADRPGAAFTMRKETATFLATLRGSGGAPAFPDIGTSGGTLLKLPVLVSAACEFNDSPPTGFIGLLNPSEILWNEGDAVLSTSTAASLLMDDDPDSSGAGMVSMFQAGAIALKALRRAGWFAKPGAAAYYTVAY